MDFILPALSVIVKETLLDPSALNLAIGFCLELDDGIPSAKLHDQLSKEAPSEAVDVSLKYTLLFFIATIVEQDLKSEPLNEQSKSASISRKIVNDCEAVKDNPVVSAAYIEAE